MIFLQPRGFVFDVKTCHYRSPTDPEDLKVQGICIKMPLFRACPNCGSQVHVRKLVCPCGHVFRGSTPLTTRNASRKSDVSAARALETEEQTVKRRKSDRDRAKETRALETEEQTVKRRKSDRDRAKKTRALETAEQTVKRRKDARDRAKETRALETEEQTVITIYDVTFVTTLLSLISKNTSCKSRVLLQIISHHKR